MLLLKNLLFTLIVPGTWAVYLPLFLVRERAPASGWPSAVAVAMLAIGLGIYSWCVWDFVAVGRGTPAPIEAPRTLVARGPYRYTRNPMYVAVLTVILGWALLYRAAVLVVYAVFVNLCFHLFVVRYEERRLEREFGSEYRAYRGRVGRWLPRIRRPAAG
jgi:protein-S-isoprenylcysteine O-methyltransferase Ste14